MAISDLTDENQFWNALKKAHRRLPASGKWVLAVASKDGAKAVNVFEHDSLDAARSFFEEQVGNAAITQFFEADAANAVGLGK
ncbi:hypothetical protein [Microbacterium sp. LWH12-1.2]|uniref:hypothetical protein n=1 Tax=Microbacterium sp. LWH12-1.2 TaxID=3135259 RepID=UPI00342CC093